jgi:hypothetical protein
VSDSSFDEELAVLQDKTPRDVGHERQPEKSCWTYFLKIVSSQHHTEPLSRRPKKREDTTRRGLRIRLRALALCLVVERFGR